MKITIHGSNGTGNVGDNIILLQLLHFLENQFPRAIITILCRDSIVLERLLLREMRHSTLKLKVLRNSFKHHAAAVLKACIRCDLFILGGGGILWGKVPGNLSYWLRLPVLAKLAGKKVVFYSLGIYEIEGTIAKRLLAKFARSVDFLSVRDLEGLAQLRRLGLSKSSIELGADPAFLLPRPKQSEIDTLLEVRGLASKTLIGISGRDWREHRGARVLAEFAEKVLLDPSNTLLFFALKTGGDRNDTDADDMVVASQLLQAIPAELRSRVIILGEDTDLDEIVKLMAACSYLIGMRLHSLILATITGTPFGALAPNDKAFNYMKMIGRHEFCLKLADSFGPEDILGLAERLKMESESTETTGSVSEISEIGLSLSERAERCHKELATKLHEWFGDSY